jgi:hypothetical protein
MNFFIYRAFFRNRLSPPDPDPDLDPLTLLNPDPVRIRTPVSKISSKHEFPFFSLPFLETFIRFQIHCCNQIRIQIRALVFCHMSPTYRYTFLNEYKIYRDLYRLGGHSKSFGQTKTSSSGEEERINIKPRIITVLRSVPY